MSRNRLDAGDLVRPFHGVRARAILGDSLELRCRALTTRLRADDAFSGPTAAGLWGMPLPRAGRGPVPAHLHVSSLLPTRALRRDGVIGTGRRSGHPVDMRGLPVLSVWDSCRSLATMIGVDDLIRVLDFVLGGDPRRPALSTPADLSSYLAQHEHHPGVRRLRRAATEARVGSWSPLETTLRLVLTRAGIPEPELNLRLRLPDGREVIADLAWPEFRVAAEYNGAHHDDPAQQIHDLRRIDDFTDIDWTTVNIERIELLRHPESVVARVSRRLQSRGWSHSPIG